MAGPSSSNIPREEEYPYPSHVCAPNFVTVKLSGRDVYKVWKTQMLRLLEGHDMLGFINRSPPPLENASVKGKEIAAGEDNVHKLWKRSDALVAGWILGSLSQQTLNDIIVNRDEDDDDFTTAKELWDRLRTIHGPVVQYQAAPTAELLRITRLLRWRGLRGGWKIKYLGGLHVLLTCADVEEVDDILAVKDLWMPWFSKLDIWRGQSFLYERVAWIKVRGVPRELWSRETFNAIGSSVGSLGQPSEACLEDGDMSGDYLSVIVSSPAPINEARTVVWQGKKFRCSVTKVCEDWRPDFILRQASGGMEKDAVSPEKEES
ncbi:hypothetical protein SSX86_015656 [Deinandra increscens subsp. villosa]|uniref:DUF4283 domain-containing protein n=1 Tax=Deinandra increscens subsp. villosa TaxID=3103831 RepID=A0AAP0GWE4_9ASTR